MKTIDKMSAQDTPCVLQFDGFPKIAWLVRLPLGKSGPPWIELNHPGHGDMVRLHFKGATKKHFVHKFVEVTPVDPEFDDYSTRSRYFSVPHTLSSLFPKYPI